MGHSTENLRAVGSGVMPGRTWVVAPDKPTLTQRWERLINAKQADKAGLFTEHDRDRRVDTVISIPLPGFPENKTPIGKETGSCPAPVRIGYRSFDRQWIIPDKRLINQPNPTLWSIRSGRQLFLTAPHTMTPRSGPAATFTSEIPDIDHYRGSFGGRAYPLWRDPAGTNSNFAPGLLKHLTEHYGSPVAAEDMFAYLGAILAHPGYTSTFADDLLVPGIRVPVTGDVRLFSRAVQVGRRVLWLHSYGQRFSNPADNRLKSPPRLPHDRAPGVMAGYPIPGDSEHIPDLLGYDADKQQLHVGAGRIANVTQRMRNYEVAQVNVLNKWFGYRRGNRERPTIGNRHISDLQKIPENPKWRAEYTSELIDLLNVLGLLAELEPKQAELIAAIIDGPLISVDDLKVAKILPISADARKPPKAQVTLSTKSDGMLL